MRQKRLAIYGFENGEFPVTPPTDSNITIVSGSARTGNFGMRIAAQSGVNSRVDFTTNMQSSGRLFTRFYLKIDTLPTTRRVLFGQRPSRTSIGFFGMTIDTDGRLSLVDQTTTLATSPSALATGRWYRIELGFDGDYLKLKIDGNVEIDWTDINWSNDWTTFTIGPADSVAATYTAHIDDLVFDSDDFPGHGRVKAIFPSRVSVNTITHTVVGAADVLSAIDVSTGWTDSSYVQWSTTGGLLHLGWDASDIPSDARIIYGLQTHLRLQRVAASSVVVLAIGWNGPTNFFSGTSNSQISLAAAITNHNSGALTNQCVFGAFFPEDRVDGLTVGFNPALGTGRCLGMFFEIDYSDESSAVHPDGMVFLADFEGDTNEMLTMTNASTTGTFAADTTDSVFGAGCLSVTHAAGGRSFVRSPFPLTASSWSRFIGLSVWIKIGALPSSGTMDLLYFVHNTTFYSSVQVNSSGQVRFTAHASWGGNSAVISGLTLTTGRWYHVSLEMLPPDASSGALNGYTKLWLDDVFVGSFDYGAVINEFNTSFFVQLGSSVNVAGGSTVKYDGLCIDRHVRHTSHLKIATLFPNAPGDAPNATFTAVGAANKWDCINETGPNDGDTTYVLCPSSGTDLYHATGIPANAVTMMNHISVIGIGKRDGASSGDTDVAHAITLSHRTVSANAGDMVGSAIGAVYTGVAARIRPAFPAGQLLPSHIANMQIGMVGSAAAVRMTKLFAVVAYTAHNPRPPQRGGSSTIVG